MTPEEINDYADFSGSQVKRMIQAAIRAERERCAKIAEKYQGKAIIQFYNLGPGDPPGNTMRAAEPKDVAAAIRGSEGDIGKVADEEC